jgi:hypothetical protein
MSATTGEPRTASRPGDVLERAAHEPVSRILGEREFYGRSFTISPATLDPRPDTETLIEAAIAWVLEVPPVDDFDGAVSTHHISGQPHLTVGSPSNRPDQSVIGDSRYFHGERDCAS